MIRQCTEQDFDTICAIVNDAAMAYKGVIPANHWHEPFMSKVELQAGTGCGVVFWGLDLEGTLVGVMSVQSIQDVNLIRHAYVRPSHQRQGIGGQLLRFMLNRTTAPTLISTWARASAAIAFYEQHGFRLAAREEKDRMLPKYWVMPKRQIEASVVLGEERWWNEVLATWLGRYFLAEQVPEAMALLAQYGHGSSQEQTDRVKREAVVASQGSLDALRATIRLAIKNCRDLRTSAELNPWVAGAIEWRGDLQRYGT